MKSLLGPVIFSTIIFGLVLAAALYFHAAGKTERVPASSEAVETDSRFLCYESGDCMGITSYVPPAEPDAPGKTLFSCVALGAALAEGEQALDPESALQCICEENRCRPQ